MTLQQPSLDRIAQFVDQLKDALHPQEKMAQAQTMRLSALFEAVAAFKRDNVPTRRAPQRRLNTASFLSYLADLRRGLAAARHDGDLLNVWTIAGLKRNEVRTSAVLGWILDSNGSHGFGSAVLQALLEALIQRTGSEELRQAVLGSHYRVSAEHTSFGERDNRVDLAIEGKNCIIFIEVKIDAPEGRDQLDRYTALAKRRAIALRKPVSLVLYLNNTCPPNPPAHLIWLTWRDVARAIFSAVAGSPERTVSGAVLKQFATHISRLH
ncbi:PD-(D/E)XK nuclease family protein [Agrobacterium sp. T29]|uniref:PD-(D/E)XK nuclease family protein n=1 Tax=Agrobacterium sp. T29 TaxID=2580515 RepID=UPI00115CB496|nr:PD-(D/E)XK nuclease family protein [Agrobacterium sp. T29]